MNRAGPPNGGGEGTEQRADAEGAGRPSGGDAKGTKKHLAAGNSGPPSGGAEGTEQRSAAENSEPPNGGDAERAPGPATPEGASGRVRGARRPPPGGPAPTPPPTPLSTPALRTAHRRTAHPVAWWGWALLLATAAGRTANPCLLLLIVAVAGLVVAYCRGSEPWSGAYRVFLAIGLTAVAVRFAFYLVFGGADGPTVLFTLPAATLPDWAAGFRLGGAVTAEGALAAAYDGLRLATLLVCVGAANALASPRRLLRSVPAALYEVSVAVVVALSVAPQLVASVGRVRRARALRGNTRRDPADLMRTVVAPVLHDALDRSLALAAAMASRGYGRAAGVPPAARRATGAALLVGLTGLCAGAYALLGAATPAPLAWGVLAAGAGAAVFGIAYASKRVPHTRYRPDRFTGRDWAVLASGAAALAGTVLSGLTEPAALWPATNPLAVPALPLQAAAGVLLAAAPALLVPATPKGTP